MLLSNTDLSLRPLLTSTGSPLDEIRLSTSISLQAASLLVVLPMFCMGVFPLLLPWIGRRLSESAWIASGLFAIALASLWLPVIALLLWWLRLKENLSTEVSKQRINFFNNRRACFVP